RPKYRHQGHRNPRSASRSHGALTYTVTRAFAVSKSQAGDVKSLMANTPNRVVLITCGVKGGVDVDFNIIVDAFLTSSTAG
ncbi:MAG: Sortase family protein, partial [Pseudonocardiales bacterium]|nr:Sortase family protein [Pseudonocardiales bacterium]